MKTVLILLLSVMSTVSYAHKVVPVKNDNLIQVAILLDTSGSMSGLISQAKSQLWSILNTLSDAELNGEPARIEIALYEYGNDRLSEKDGYVLQRVAFTTDMDKISESLFSMRTNGGSEYCGEVIHQSIQQLEWRKAAGLKVLYIAGNEAFTQGSFDFRVACMEANKKEVIINTIFCGDRQQGINTDWEAGAILGKGAYHHIDHNQETHYVQTPYDDKISELNRKLNKTYLRYGERGEEAELNMRKQDDNASSYSQANVVKRAMYKSKKQYNNSSWDLVDAYEEDESIVKDKKQLPQEMQKLSEVEIKATITRYKKERSDIQAQIKTLGQQRNGYIKENASKESGGLEEAVIRSVEKELKRKGFCKG